MIIWINGAFGSGKTSAAYELARRTPDSFVYDPEEVGYFLRKRLPGGMHTEDFQDEPLWREMNYLLLKRLNEAYGGVLIVPMTVVNPQYFSEIVGRLRADGAEVRHFALCASREVLLKRLKKRGDGRNSWPAAQIERCVAALGDPVFKEQIDTDHMSVDEVISYIAAACGISLMPEKRSRFRKKLDRVLVKLRHIRFR